MDIQLTNLESVYPAAQFHGDAARQKLDVCLNEAFQEDAIGGAFGYRWEATADGRGVAPVLRRLNSSEEADPTQYAMFIVDSGNTAGDSWRYIYHTMGVGTFVDLTAQTLDQEGGHG